ncbi:MAG: hypothetical protein JO121_32285 [Deltaproteobacteria bacterium]|nr:hypothetical protein [Deltaproteobacteria bacterium]
MRKTTLIVRTVVLGGFAVGISSCATSPPPEPPPAPLPVVAAPAPVPAAPTSPDQDWNIFPDPTTGTIDIYHKGDYVGVIDGSEPKEQDPPLPHKPDRPPSDE